MTTLALRIETAENTKLAKSCNPLLNIIEFSETSETFESSVAKICGK